MHFGLRQQHSFTKSERPIKARNGKIKCWKKFPTHYMMAWINFKLLNWQLTFDLMPINQIFKQGPCRIKWSQTLRTTLLLFCF